MRTRTAVAIVGCAALAAGLFFTRQHWTKWVAAKPAATAEGAATPLPPTEVKVLKMTAQARQNLGLVAKPLMMQSYWRTILLPGTIVDRPGLSDRGVTAPAVGVVTQVHAFPGDTVKPGDVLFTLRVFSEYLQNTQSELFKATREIQLLKEQLNRLEGLAETGAIAQSRTIELNNQLRRQTTAIQAYRQDLLTRGLTAEQIDRVAEGTFVSTIEVVAPQPPSGIAQAAHMPTSTLQLVGEKREGLTYEVQELKVELGQQVQAGQLLSILANHYVLYIEGHAFKRDASYLEEAAQNSWPVKVEFTEDDAEHWPPIEETFQIRHLSNTIDPDNRSFSFFLPLTNQLRSYSKDGRTFVVWRFRPGQRVRLYVPVEEFKDVMVLPAGAIVREGPEAYMFQQNGDLFNRIPVHVLYEDRLNVVIGADEDIYPGIYIAQSSAASLQRVLKAQAASGMRADVHVHADGTVHGAH